nr:relaxase/mobilization nuclease domain-containing protein [Shinella kummerowiae]
MASREAVIKRVPKGGTCSIKGLARQLGYLSRQNDPDRETIELVGAQRHDFHPDTPDAVNPNDVWAFARRVYERSGRLPPDDPNGDLANDLTMHFVFSFPAGTDLDAAERAGRDWAEYVFGHGYRNDQGFVQRHDYVTAFHRYENDSEHPHMHVVVDRSPLGGGNLLTLHEGHPHWSYEAMRVQAVEAAANHGIELVATTRADRGLTDRPMTDVEFREFQRLLTQRPITQDEALRRQADGATVPYSDPDYEANGVAPDDGDDLADRTADDLRRGCTPTFLPDNDDDDPGPFDPGGGGDDDDGGNDGDDQDRRRRSSSPPPSRGQGGDNRRGPFQARRRDQFSPDDDDDDMDDAPGAGAQRQQTQGAKRKQTDDDQPGPTSKRPRKNQTGGGGAPIGNRLEGGRAVPDNRAGASLPLNAANLERLQQELEAQRLRSLAAQQAARDEAANADRNPSAAGDGAAGSVPHDNRSDAAPAPQDPQQGRKRPRLDDEDQAPRKRGRAGQAVAGPATIARDTAAPANQQTAAPVQPQPGGTASRLPQQGSAAELRREAAINRRQASVAALHAHRETRDVNGGNTQAWRDRERQLLHESRQALIEQRRAHAGLTNVETRAQEEERLRRTRDRGADDDRRDGRDPRDSRSD